MVYHLTMLGDVFILALQIVMLEVKRWWELKKRLNNLSYSLAPPPVYIDWRHHPTIKCSYIQLYQTCIRISIVYVNFWLKQVQNKFEILVNSLKGKYLLDSHLPLHWVFIKSWISRLFFILQGISIILKSLFSNVFLVNFNKLETKARPKARTKQKK